MEIFKNEFITEQSKYIIIGIILIRMREFNLILHYSFKE